MSFKNVLFKVMLALIIILGVIYLLFEKGDAASDKSDKKESVAAESASESRKKGKGDGKKNSEKNVAAKTKEEASAKAKKERIDKEKKEKEKAEREKAAKEKKEKEKKAREKAAKKRKEKLNSGKISSILSDSLVTASSGYFEVTKSESVRVFAEDITNGFGMQTLASYNLWGNNVGECTYSMAKLKKYGGKILHIYTGLEDGGSGTVKAEIFMDKTTDENPDYTFEINAETVPGQIDIDITNAGSMTIRVNNQSGNPNNVVFYGMSLS